MYGIGVSSRAVINHVFWVDWFHEVPHINLTLHRVNDTFDPLSSAYQESLGIIGSVPAAILILTLLVLLLYLLTRCCDTRPRKAGSIACLKATCVITSLLTLGALGVSVWANEQVHAGLSRSIHSLSSINNLLISLSNTTQTFDETIQHNLQPELNMFREMVEKKKIANTTARIALLENLSYIRSNISDILLINVEDIRNKLNRGNLTEFVKVLGITEIIRWICRLSFTIILMMVVLIVPIGVGRHSRCTLITFSVLGLKSLIVCWAMTSAYLVMNVAISDWCINPEPFLQSMLGRVIPGDVVTYYMRCDPTQSSPFTKHLTHAQQAADVIDVTLEKVTQIADENYPQNDIHPRLDRFDAYVKQSQGTLGSIAGLLECHAVYQEYLNLLGVTCNDTISGFVYLLFSAAGSGLLFTLLVWFTSHTWIYLNNKSEVIQCDVRTERERFLPDRSPRAASLNSVAGSQGHPRPRHAHTPPQTPPFPGTLNGRMFHSDGLHAAVPTHSTSATMPRNHHHGHHHSQSLGPNTGQYATLSKQCKTLESSDFY